MINNKNQEKSCSSDSYINNNNNNNNKNVRLKFFFLLQNEMQEKFTCLHFRIYCIFFKAETKFSGKNADSKNSKVPFPKT